MSTNLAQRSKLRVLHVSRDAGYGGLGGAEILVMEFVRRLDPERFERYLCTTRMPEIDRRELEREETAELVSTGVHVVNLGRRSSRSVLPWGRLWRLIRRERIDVVHAHMFRANVPGVIFARLAGVPVVVSHEHGSNLYGLGVRRVLNENIVGRLSDIVLAVSGWDRERLITDDRLPADRVQVLANGILPLAAGTGDVREQLGPPGVPLVGALGRLDPVKGYDDLIRAMGLLRDQGIRLHCVIAGMGSDEARLTALIAELGLEDRVELLGLRDDVPSLLAAFDVAVMSSHSEGAPLAMIEYMAAGLPIVATRVGGIPELIQDGEHGLLVTPNDPAALAAGLARLLDDPALARRLGDAARDRQRTEYDLDRSVRRLETLYLDLYGAARSRRRHRRRRP